ncbi:MAG: pullulanase-type alpha-1,6-glucosidase [Flaviflexus sp.]|nr:pullulanase-type alpha-1,6-glucosidase [Flaviflexus sp.]
MQRRTWAAFGAAVLATGVAVPMTAQAEPETFTAAGSFNSAIGCEDDWAPECELADLQLDEATGRYSATFDLPAGDYEFKIARNHSWDENWGSDGVPGGDNMAFTATEEPTHIIFDPVSKLAVAGPDESLIRLAGSFQNELGCENDWEPACLATVMFPKGEHYVFVTDKLTKSSYEYKVTHGPSWGENYGVGGAADGSNYSLSTTPGDTLTFTYDPSTHIVEVDMSNPPLPGDGLHRAIWISGTELAIPAELTGDSYSIVDHPELTVTEAGQVSNEEAAAFPRTAGYTKLVISAQGDDEGAVRELLRGPVTVEAESGGEAVARTNTQIAGALDALYPGATERPLGVVWNDEVPSLALWAPTAMDVTATVWVDGEETTVAATRDDDGVWTVPGEASWKNAQYLWNVDVYVPSAGEIVTNAVTDPYSVGLTMDSTRSVIVDLDDPALAPADWESSTMPKLRTQAEQTIYELHIRDFSIADTTVPEGDRGSYRAFTHAGSAGMSHLAELAAAGMTTVHLLPSFDIATIPENRADQKVPEIPDAGPDSPEQQAAVAAVKDADGFNWGYDPFHWTTPEGSYATEGNQDGGARTLEYRQMVKALHDIDLRVIQDVVYNHTAGSGQGATSVLDKVVPGYYHRLNATGQIETSSCCENVATENAMAEKMMIDSIVTWAKDYHIDGFRFDLMGHHSLENMTNIRAALDELTVAKDGVDGSAIYLYGEAWNFGEVIDDALFVQARQAHIAGTGIGTFNDRIRDAVRGGGPFDDDQRSHQGFGSGLFTDPNGYSPDDEDTQLDQLRYRTDLVRIGLTGNLADYTFDTKDGLKAAKEVDYGGQEAGYAAQPQETINYVDAHDNESLYDNGVWKLPTDASMDTRVRMNSLSLAAVTLGQAPSFWHAGTEILRSKSLDRDSYNSGDHFNAIDWSLESNVFGTGLPIKEKNGEKWESMKPLLANAELKPTKADMDKSRAMALDLLRLRHSTPLFTLGSGELIAERVSFPNAGPEATPGLLVMRITDPGEGIDPNIDDLLVVFNASPDTITEEIDGIEAGTEFELSDIQAAGADDVVKETTWDAGRAAVTIPARTVAVLVSAPAKTTYTPSAEVEPKTAKPGESVLITGTGFQPGEDVILTINGEEISSAVAEDGTVAFSYKIPADAIVGTRSVVLNQPGVGEAGAAFAVTSSGATDDPSADPTTPPTDEPSVDPTADPTADPTDATADPSGEPEGGDMPHTGASVLGLIAASALAVLGGAALVRRRRAG